MKKVTTFRMLTVTIMALASTIVFADGHLSDHFLFTAKLTGDQEVPPVTTNATGVGVIKVNASRDSMCISLAVNGLSSPIMGFHIHEGEVDSNGPVVIGLTEHITGNRASVKIAMTAEQLEKMLSDEYYFNVHTTDHPAGEIRGQIELESDDGLYTMLDGDSEVPSVSTPGFGLATIKLSHDHSKLEIKAIVQALKGEITASHLHIAPSGVNGPVEIPLNTGINGNIISVTVNNPDPSFIDTLFDGHVYINVHTDSFPDGEIRGNFETPLIFDAWLTHDQEVPPSSNPAAKGLAAMVVDETIDTMWFTVVSDSLSDTVTAAHFHHGASGTNGPVMIGLSSSIVGKGNLMQGMVAPLLPDTINRFLRGEVYLNLHTQANPGGEIRGQVYRLLREGYMVNLDGFQEVPDVNTAAMGGGFVSIDRDQTNARFGFVVSDLSGAASAAHFHKGVVDSNGGVVFNLSTFFSLSGPDDDAWGYWRDSDGFTVANSLQFRNDSIYVNVHTAAHPGGEIRGQVLRNAPCYSIQPCDSPTAAFGYDVDGLTVHFADSSSLADSLRWDFGDGNTSSEETPTHTYDDPDIYTVCLSVLNGCSVDSTCKEVDVAVGIAEQTSLINNVAVFPNPAADFVNVAVTASRPASAALELFNLLGEAVYSRNIRVGKGINSFTIDLENLPEGVYLLKLYAPEDGAWLYTKLSKH